MHVGTQGDSGGGGGRGFVPLRLFLLRSAVFSHFRQGLFCEQDRTYFQTSAGEEGFKTKVTFCQIHLQQEQQQRLLRLGPLGELEREILPGGEWVERGKVFLGSTSLVFPHPPERRNRRRRRKFPLLSLSLGFGLLPHKKRSGLVVGLLGWSQGLASLGGIGEGRARKWHKMSPSPSSKHSFPPLFFGQHKQTNEKVAFISLFRYRAKKSFFFPACPPTLGVFWEPLPKYCSLFRSTIRLFPCAPPPPFRQGPLGESGGGSIYY